MVEEWAEETLSDLPPSSKLVYKVLEYNGRMPQKRLVEETRLSSRTLRYAITQLEDAGLVESQPVLYDARQTCYSLVRDVGSGYGRNGLVDPDWVHERLSSFQRDDSTARLVYVATEGADGPYVPGSVVLNVESDLLYPNRQRMPDPPEFEALLGRTGVTEDTTLVLYDEGMGYYAAYVYWILAYYGHGDKRLLDGGLAHWLDAGCPTTDVQGSFPADEYTVRGEFEYVRALRRDVVRALSSDTILLDVRDPSEFRGDSTGGGELSASTHNQGHIPGATNVPLDRLLDEDDRFAPRSDLEAVFADADVTSDRRIIVYCGVGARSALVWFVLSELLGYPDVMNYDGSWTEWGSLVDAPVETE